MADNQRVTEVECPVLKKMIKDIDCIENRDIVDGNLDERFLPEGFKERRIGRALAGRASGTNTDPVKYHIVKLAPRLRAGCLFIGL